MGLPILQCCNSVQYLTERAVPAGIAGTGSIRHTLGHTAVRALSITHVPRGTATDHTLYTCKVNTALYTGLLYRTKIHMLILQYKVFVAKSIHIFDRNVNKEPNLEIPGM